MMNHSSILLVLWIVAIASPAYAQSSRQEEIARKGTQVMPFDLARTRHFFDDTPTGGVETVTANDPHDAKQIALIRAHLQVESQRFARGDFADPAAIHGADMPGLAALADAGSKLAISYSSIPAGASIRYTSADAAVVRAIHQWFAAQRSDHDAHAHMHP
jgi:hypothetical protein